MVATVEVLVRREAIRQGFDAVGIARVDDLDPGLATHLETFIADGHHGEMTWIAETASRRRHPRAMWPTARSAIMLGLSYAPGTDPLARLAERSRGLIASYAKGRDYHDIVKPALKRVAGALHRSSGAAVKVFVDTAPLMEKPLAAMAGLGWQGKHTNLVSRRHGSWLLLGAILTEAELSPDAAEADHCGTCRRCLDVCPTKAFPQPYRLDARRCISYLTIEHKGPIPRALRAAIGNRVYGCDDCLAVCPWNRFATAAREQRLAATTATDDPPLGKLLGLDDAAFRRRFAGTPVKRTGRDRFLRNVLIAAGNSGDGGLVAKVRRCLDDGSALVRGAAVWALAQLVPAGELAALAEQRAAAEPDAGVGEEWAQAVERARHTARSGVTACLELP